MNGANFVYFGMRLKSGEGDVERRLAAYASQVAAALGVLHGPTHMEVKFGLSGPCLVEVGARCQGGEGTWLPVAQECIGYTQVDATLDVYLGGADYDKLDGSGYKLNKVCIHVHVYYNECMFIHKSYMYAIMLCHCHYV